MSKKLIAFALAGIFALSMVAPAKAVTIEELQVQITALLAQITALQAQIAGQTTGTVCFNTDLSQGMTANDVKNLQIVLNKNASTQVAPSGAGSPGNETTYFGSLTFAAVKNFQASKGIVNTGYVGPLTRAQLNALYCTPVTTTTTVAPGSTTTTTLVAATEGSLTVTQNPIPGSGTVTVYGGDINREIAAYKIKATNSDVRLKRILLQFGIAADFPWRDLSSLSLWDGTTLLKEISASQANWNEVVFATTYTMQFDGLDVLVAKDTEKVLSLKATALSVPQYIGNITALIPANGVRGVDTAGLNVYGPAANLAAHIFVNAAAQAPTLTVTADTNNPLAGNVIANLTSISRADLLKINVRVEGVDMTLKGGQITLTTDSGNIISGLELYDGSTLLASAADPGQGGTAAWSTFTLAVSAATTKVLTVKGVLPAAPAAGSQLKVDLPVTVGLTGIDTNGAARNNGAQIVAGNTLRVYVIAPTFAYSTSGYAVSGSNPNGGHPNDLGTGSITFTVTANGGDIYIATTTVITDNIGPAAPTSSDAWSCNSPGETNTNAGFWRIPAGNTAACIFTDQITNVAGTAGWFQPTITNISWMTSATTTGDIDQVWGLTTLKTSQFYLGI